MEKQMYEIIIRATPEKVWRVLWGEETYPKWTHTFSAGSKAVSDWQEGSKVLFTDQSNSGIVGVIVKNIPDYYMSIRYTGFVEEGIEKEAKDEFKE